MQLSGNKNGLFVQPLNSFMFPTTNGKDIVLIEVARKRIFLIKISTFNILKRALCLTFTVVAVENSHIDLLLRLNFVFNSLALCSFTTISINFTFFGIVMKINYGSDGFAEIPISLKGKTLKRSINHPGIRPRITEHHSSVGLHSESSEHIMISSSNF